MILTQNVVVKVQAKSFRSNWVSYMVSLGVPIAVTAVWAGHKPAVLAKHYYDYAAQRNPGNTIEEAMGIRKLIRDKYGLPD